MRRISQVAIAAALLSSVASAQAETFGQQGEVAVSVERLFGFVHTIESHGDSTSTVDSISLFASPLSGLVSSYSAPRAAFDYFAAPGFSLGAGLGFQHAANGAESSDSVDVLEFAPRVGYAAEISPTVSIWPRLGPTVVSTSAGSQTLHLFALTLDAPIVISPAPHAALTIGPTLDLGLGGSRSGGASIKETGIGLQTGLLIYL